MVKVKLDYAMRHSDAKTLTPTPRHANEALLLNHS